MNGIFQSSSHCRHAAKMKRHGAGFTMVELMVAVAIACVLAALAAPSFSSLTANQRAKAVASELYVSLARARSEAITRNLNVTLLPKGGGWQNGWQILDPVNGAVLDDHGVATGATVSGPDSLTYRGSGRIQTNRSTSFIVTTTAGSTDQYQCISVDLTGRPYMKAAASC